MAYYFFVASLPTLALDEPPPMTGEAFLADCMEMVSREDYEDLCHVIRGEPEKAGHQFVRDWICRETLLRNAIARSRATRLGVEPEPFLKYCEFYESSPDEAAAEILRRSHDSQAGEANPLERELALDRFRWETIEEMAVFDPFGMPALLAFALKLNLSIRWSRMKEEQGRAAVDNFVESSLKQ